LLKKAEIKTEKKSVSTQEEHIQKNEEVIFEFFGDLRQRKNYFLSFFYIST